MSQAQASGETASGHRVVVSEFGETPLEGLENFASLQPQPRPDALADDQVLISVRSSAVGWVDLLMMSGQYQHMPDPPYTPGLEYAGEVAAVGKGVTTCAVGDAAMIDPFLAGPRISGEYGRSGGFASWAVVPQAAVMQCPAGLDYDQACNLLGSYETGQDATHQLHLARDGRSAVLVSPTSVRRVALP